jgi:uncharacterized membrane protein (UPF0127 family)
MIGSVSSRLFCLMKRALMNAPVSLYRVRMARRTLALVLACCGLMPIVGVDLSSVQTALFQPAFAQTPPAQKALEKLTIATPGGEKIFQVEVMRTMDERARGLMFRRYLPADRGMLFDFAAEAQVAMWMKDTFIPLDMLFIRKDGTISQIAENTEPHSTRTISSTDPVHSVLEINGGMAAKLGIKAGDKVIHPLFSPR